MYVFHSLRECCNLQSLDGSAPISSIAPISKFLEEQHLSTFDPRRIPGGRRVNERKDFIPPEFF